METPTPEVPRNGQEVAFRPLSGLVRVVPVLAIGTVAFVAGMAGTASHLRLIPLLAGLAAYLAMMVLVFVGQAAWQRRRGGTPAMLFADDALYLPPNAVSTRRRAVPYTAIRAANLAGRGWFSMLVLDTAARPYAYPLRRFADKDAPARVFTLLHDKIVALPDGAAQWDRIARMQAEAEQLRAIRPWAIWLLSAGTALIFALQLAWPYLGGGPRDGFAAVDLGANAFSLVAQGQAWRLVSANLLHANPQHVLNNLLFLVVIGGLLERLIGMGPVVLVVLATGIASEAASTAVGPYFGGYIYSVGISGALFGLVGVLAVITWRLGQLLPAGYRLSLRVWVVLLGLNLLAPLLVPQVDKAAHLGGLLAGVLLGWVLFARRGTLAELKERSAIGELALAGFAALWLASLTLAARHAVDPGARLADRVILVRAELTAGHAAPTVQNSLAYALALQPAAGAMELQDARYLAVRALTRTANDRRDARLRAAMQDTIAVLDDRLGDTRGALVREARALNVGGGEIPAHLTRMLATMVARSGPQQIGGPIAPPTLALEGGTLRFHAPMAVPQGGEVIALLRRHGAVQGMMRMFVPPGFSGDQILPLPVRYGGPTAAPPDAMWLDGGSTIEVGLFDTTGCHCEWPSMAPWWYPRAAELAALP